jgi:hypothetical protein
MYRMNAKGNTPNSESVITNNNPLDFDTLQPAFN